MNVTLERSSFEEFGLGIDVDDLGIASISEVDVNTPAERAARAEPAGASPVPPPSRLGTRRDSEPLPPQEPAWATAPRARGRDSTERVGDVSVRRLSYTPGASEDPLAPDETPQSALEVVVPDSMV